MEQHDIPIRSSPGRTIVGLVDAGGAAGVKGESNEWRLVFHLAAWRQPGYEVMRGERRCEMPVTEEGLQAFRQRVRPYAIIGAEIKETPNEGPIQLARLVQIGMEDTELAQIASELQKPIIIAHPTFGELKYDRRVRWYDDGGMFLGHTIEVRGHIEDGLVQAGLVG